MNTTPWPAPAPAFTTPPAWPATNAPQQAPANAIFNTPENPIDPNQPERFRSLGPLTRDGALMKHAALQKELAKIKEQELELRTAVAMILLRDPAAPPKKDGVNNIPLGNGYVAKVGVKVNYNLRSYDEKTEVVDAVDGIASRMAQISNEGGFIADRLFKWSVDISVSEYKKLEADAETQPLHNRMLALVNLVLEKKEGTPTLEIKAPK